jgi:hypothetical protein
MLAETITQIDAPWIGAGTTLSIIVDANSIIEEHPVTFLRRPRIYRVVHNGWVHPYAFHIGFSPNCATYNLAGAPAEFVAMQKADGAHFTTPEAATECAVTFLSTTHDGRGLFYFLDRADQARLRPSPTANGSAFPLWLKSIVRVILQLRRAAVLRPWNAFAFLLASSLATMASQSSWANGFSRVRHVRGCVISLGSFAAFTYFLAVFRSMSALRAARPISPCLLISSISFLTCASLTARKTPASSSRKRVVLEHRVTRQ